ncbi:MAG: radical SAM protein [Candidatus Hydrogenedentota bacterium]
MPECSDRGSHHLVSTMAKAGSYALSFGIESATNRILKEIKKVLTVEQTIEKVNMVHDAAPSIMLQGFFMIGFPDATEEEIEATIELARSLPLNIAIFSPLRPTLGTKIYEDLVNSGVIYANLEYDPEGMGQHYFVRS